MLGRVPAARLHARLLCHPLLQRPEEAAVVQQRVPQAAHDAVVAVKVGLVVGAMGLARDEDARLLNRVTAREQSRPSVSIRWCTLLSSV